MKNPAIKAALTQKDVTARDPKDFRDNDALIASFTLVNCGDVIEHTIEVEFYKYKNFACRVNIRDSKTATHLIAVARESTRYLALHRALERAGIVFEPSLLSISEDYHNATPVESAMNAIADALEIPIERRTIVSTEVVNIHAC
jgi:hypothetical protein